MLRGAPSPLPRLIGTQRLDLDKCCNLRRHRDRVVARIHANALKPQLGGSPPCGRPETEDAQIHHGAIGRVDAELGIGDAMDQALRDLLDE